MKNNILVLILVAGLLVLGFLYMKEKSTPDSFDNNFTNTGAGIDNTTSNTTPGTPTNSNPSSPTGTNNPTVSNTNWESFSTPSAYSLATNGGVYLSGPNVSLSQSVDLTGDGVQEGVFVGDGGNSGVTFILIKDSNGQNVLARQKNRDGSITPVNLVSVGRVMVSESFKLIPQQNGFYTVSKSNANQDGYFVCNADGVNAYVWSNTTSLFEWNQSLTYTYTSQECA